MFSSDETLQGTWAFRRLVDNSVNYFLKRRLAAPASPTKPVPNSNMLAGSGVVPVGVGTQSGQQSVQFKVTWSGVVPKKNEMFEN